MSLKEQHTEFVLRWYNEVWNNNNEALISEMLHPECNALGLGEEPVIGSDGFKEVHRFFNANYENIHIDVHEVFVDGDYATAICTFTANYKPTNAPVKFSGTSITRIVNQQITAAWNFFDFLTLNLQIGKINAEQLK
jgi:predicted ester cyclase